MIVGYLDIMCNVIPLKVRQHFLVSGTTYINRKDKEARLGRDNFPGGLLFYEVGYSGRRRRLIVVCSQWMIPGVSILNVLHCFGISPEGVLVNNVIYSGRIWCWCLLLRLIVVCSER